MKALILHPILQKVWLASEIAFRELIKTHLAQILELETGFDLDQIYIKSNIVRPVSVFGADLSEEGVCQVNQLILYIKQEKNVVQEGVFRRAGSKNRQAELQTMISSGESIWIDSNRFSVHDCCGVLKRFIGDLPLPLLTNILQPLFVKAAIDLDGKRQLDAIRLLILLLPSVNRSFLYDLLDLFNHVTQYFQQNKMTVENISTVIAPKFFHTKNHSGTMQEEFDKNQTFINSLSVLIRNFKSIFDPPEQVIHDAIQYLSNRKKQETLAAKSAQNSLVSSTNLSAIPTTKFCTTQQSSYSTKDYTQMALAELYAQIQSSPKTNKKLLKKFNHNRKGFVDGTPLILQRDKQQQKLIKESLKKCRSTEKSNLKSIGSAIKKRLLLTPKTEKSSKIIRVDKKSSPCTINSPDFQKNSISPRSVVPIDELELTPEFQSISRIPLPERLQSASNENESNVSVLKVSNYAQPVNNNTVKRSRSNSVYSATRLASTASLINQKENQKQKGVVIRSRMATIQSLPTNLSQVPQSPQRDQMVKRKRVKYLASQYEALISSSSKTSKNLRPIQAPPQSPMADNSSQYVSLTSIYTKTPFENKKLPMRSCSTNTRTEANLSFKRNLRRAPLEKQTTL